MKRVFRLLAVGLLVGVFVLPARAAEFRSDEESLSVSETETPRDLHLAGRNIITDAKIRGDLLIAGETILVNGEVENSLFIVGGMVTVRSHVSRHVRIIGGTVILSGKVDGDVYIAGGDVVVTDSAEIGGGLYVASDTLIIEGKITGELRVGGRKVELSGQVGPTKIYGGDVHLTSKAKINGNFTYKSDKLATVDKDAVITGQTNYAKYQTAGLDKYGFFFGAAFTLGYFLRLLGAVLLGWLIVRYWPKTARKVADFALGTPLPAIGFGLLALIGVIVSVAILAISVIGIGVAGIVFVLWLLTLMVGSIVGKMLLGSWLYRLVKREKGFQLTLGTVALGVLVSSALLLVPVIGPIVGFVFFLLGVGAVFNLLIHASEAHSAVPKN